ncbi:MAG: hypothetical protein WBD20_21760 [Pirellulaceae bacterium]
MMGRRRDQSPNRLGAMVGVALAVVLGMFLTSPLMNFEESVVANGNSGDLNAMLLQVVQWVMIGLPIAFAVRFGTGRVPSGLKAFGAVVLAAIVGGVVYVIGGTILDPVANLAYAQPVEGKLSYLWHFASPLLVGLFLSRSRL